MFLAIEKRMSDFALIYRGADLIVDDSITLTSLDTGSLLVSGLEVRPIFITKFTTPNLNNALSTPLLMDPIGEFNNMPSALAKASTSVINVLTAGTYFVHMILNVTASASSVQVQFLKGVSVVATANFSASDSQCILAFPITLAALDTLSFNCVRISGSNAKNLFPTSSSLFITKLA